MPVYYGRGQQPGTNTSDNASVGAVGEYISAVASNIQLPVTITIATPGVITMTAHGLALGSPLFLTTSGALPTGLTINTTYWIIPVDANSFKLATTVANAIAGTAINTTGSQSGTHTGQSSIALTTSTAANIAFISLSAGDWDVYGTGVFLPAGTTTVSAIQASINTVSATMGTFPNSGAMVTEQGTLATGSRQDAPVGRIRISISATTTVYLVTLAVFAISTLTSAGFIGARRVR